MQSGKYKLSDRVSNKNSNKNVGGVRGLMKECSIYGEQLRALDEKREFISKLDSEDREKFFEMIRVAKKMQRDAEDAPIIAAYDAKKEELEHLYKMPDSHKKRELIEAAKKELDEMYNKNVCIRKNVYETKQARKAQKVAADFAPFKKDLMNISGRVMRESECKAFLARAEKHLLVKSDGVNSWFFLDDVMYKTVKVKNGFMWTVSII